jgi:hypothetical protein
LKYDGSVVAWGSNRDDQCNVPAGNDYVAIAAGYTFSLALKSDGSLTAWGLNRFGECNVPAGYDFVAIAAGGFMKGHSLALKSNGSVVAWGDNSYGQCNVPDGNDFVAVAAGASHSLALKSDGSVVAWGRNDKGQCDVPSGKGNDFVAIAAGSSHSLALIKESETGYPTADAGDDIVASANEEVTLDGSNSHDIDGDIILYTWKRLPDEVVIYSGMEPTCKTRALGRAEEVIELTVIDNNQIGASDTVVIVNRMLKDLRDIIDSKQVGDLNLDRNVDSLYPALLGEDWLR